MTNPLRQVLIEWIADLRSGKYEQIRMDWGYGDKRCALSVLSIRHHAAAGNAVMDLRLPDGDFLKNKILYFNDIAIRTFPEIADWLEREVLPMFPDQMTVG